LKQIDNLEVCNKAISAIEKKTIAELLEANIEKFVREKILELTVLDPAMGSGHFCVNATNKIANFITEFMNDFDILGNLQTGTKYLRRLVVENCIYGVDVNSLAVELAKLSLWIQSMAKDQPLSFINHHLKCGDSLIGVRLSDIGHYPFSKSKQGIHQLSLFEIDKNFKNIVDIILANTHLINQKYSNTIEDIKEKIVWLEEIENLMKKYKSICDVHTSVYFGNDLSEEQYHSLVEAIGRQEKITSNYENRFFHWELEFPEILLKKDGFDIIIGNPPYANIPDDMTHFCLDNYISDNSKDLYTLFIERSIFLSNSKSYSGLILPLSITFSKNMKEIRDKISTIKFRKWKVSSFDRIPDALFGSNVRTRNSILLSEPKDIYPKSCTSW
jgi:type I restriction-modification system DNA methylase subunit